MSPSTPTNNLGNQDARQIVADLTATGETSAVDVSDPGEATGLVGMDERLAAPGIDADVKASPVMVGWNWRRVEECKETLRFAELVIQSGLNDVIAVVES